MRILKIFILIVYGFSIAKGNDKSDLFFQQLTNYCQSKKQSCSSTNRASASQDAADASFGATCMFYYEENHCEEVKSLLPPTERADVITCNPNFVCNNSIPLSETKCHLDGFNSMNISLSIGIGAVTTVAASFFGSIGGGTIVGLPILVYGAGKSAEVCSKDINYKKMVITLHNLALLANEKALDFNGENKQLLNYECDDLKKFLNTREEVLVNKRLEQQRWSLTGASLSAPMGQTLLEILKSNRCLHPKAIAKRYCSALSSILISSAASGFTSALTKPATRIIANNSALSMTENQITKPTAVATSTPAPAPSKTIEPVVKQEVVETTSSPPPPKSTPRNKFVVKPMDNRMRHVFKKPSAQLIKDFPAVNNKLKEIDNFNLAGDSSKKALAQERAELVRDLNLYEKLDDKMHDLFQNILPALSDMSNWKNYTKNLYLSSVEWTIKNGNKIELEALRDGEVSRRAIIGTLSDRLKSRGEKLVVVTGTDEKIFYQGVGKGPFFDKGLSFDNPHGQLSHLLQFDYLSPVLKQMQIPPQQLHQFLAARQGHKYWDSLFDDEVFQGLFSTPENINREIGKVLPIGNQKFLDKTNSSSGKK